MHLWGDTLRYMLGVVFRATGTWARQGDDGETDLMELELELLPRILEDVIT